MAEIKFDYKNLLEKININRFLYIIAFILVALLLLLYTLVVNNHSKTELQEMYSLKDSHDHFESMQSNFLENVQGSYIYSLLYFSENKELYRFQAINAMNDANTSYNELFSFILDNEKEFLPKIVELRTHLNDYEQSLLTKLASKIELPQLEMAPLLSEEDTLTQDFTEFQPDVEEEKISLTDEESKLKTIESDVFEMNVLLTGRNQRVAIEKAGQGVIDAKLFVLYIVLVLLVFLLLYYFINRFNKDKINKASQYLQSISTGELPEKMEVQRDDFREIVNNGNHISEYMHSASEFALKIGDGNFDYEFHPKSENDTLGNALLQMREKLQEVAIEDRVRNWVNEGQAKFGEILRESGSDLGAMGDKVISSLVEYVNASMGAIYTKRGEDGENKIELLSAFAFNRKKHEERVLIAGEGLAGQVYLEKKKVFLTDIPNDHFNIVTGMGESKPASVLIVPLRDESDVEGVLELASFKVFEQYQIDFIEKLGESIASAIKSGKSNAVTKQLLEEMQTREEQMKTQEEELKQNMEELSATQEQMERLRKEDNARKAELESKRHTLYNVLDSLDSRVYLKDAEGKYQYVNKQYAKLLGLKVEEIIGNMDAAIIGDELASQREAWENTVLKTSNTVTEEQEIKGKKLSLTLSVIEIPHLNDKGVLGVLK